ncbi:tetratricopeptide repeat protein [Arenitalea sp.]|nr:tetratricopeptide repeat protein [Algibacter sp.]MDA9070353.1 tetratricopeptide repeat protein [Algibacter sp.]
MKKHIILLLIICPIFGFAQANKLFRQATRTNNLSEKISLLTQVIKLEPQNLDAYFYRAIAKNDLGDYRGAIVDYSKVIVEEPDADTYFNRGNSRYSLKDFTGAKEDYAKAFMLDENFIDALYSLACVKLDLEEYEKAIKDFTGVIKQVPDNYNTYMLRASAYKALEQFTNALNDYSMAILIEPNADNYFNRGVFLMDIKYYQDANTDLTKSLRLNNNNSFAHFYRGASNLFLGKFNDAISDFSEAIKFDSMDFDAYLGLAMAHLKVNDTTRAKLNFNKANTILIPSKKVSTIEQYNNTYWFHNQYFYFNNSINALVNLK